MPKNFKGRKAEEFKRKFRNLSPKQKSRITKHIKIGKEGDIIVSNWSLVSTIIGIQDNDMDDEVSIDNGGESPGTEDISGGGGDFGGGGSSGDF